jgi:hypothetical protein
MPQIDFGKHKGSDIEDVPNDYLRWLIRSSQEKIDMCENELRRRSPQVNNSVMAQIVKHGRNELMCNAPASEHDDINRAHDALMKAITDAAGTQP